MAKYKIVLKPTAEKDLLKHKKSGNVASIKKITALFNDLESHPFTGIGNPEPLKHELAGFWSRKINQKDRLVYEVIETTVTVFVLSAIGHYGDK